MVDGAPSAIRSESILRSYDNRGIWNAYAYFLPRVKGQPKKMGTEVPILSMPKTICLGHTFFGVSFLHLGFGPTPKLHS